MPFQKAQITSSLLASIIVCASLITSILIFQPDAYAESLADTSTDSTNTPQNAAGTFDGPAELPRAYIKSTMADTPAPGRVFTLNEGGDLQAALDGVNCGDTIVLQAGATFSGNFKFRTRSCDDNHWIVIRTSASDSQLPAEGTRLSPCYSGVSSLPGRPAFKCHSTTVVTAKLLGLLSMGPITLAAGANHYRLTGLEIARAPAARKLPIVYQLVSVADYGAADHVIFDRVWMHGTAQDETGHGIRLDGITYAAIIDSFFTDFHCVAITGSCTDAQAISGGNGTLPGGPYKIVNNFLEAAAENILFGGGKNVSAVPADMEIRRNHFFKPLIWKQGQPGFVGGTSGHPFIVKNLFELKNAERVLFEGNVLENSWGGFSQRGFGILLTPRGSWARVQDITIRYTTINHVGAGIALTATKNHEHGADVDSQAAQRWSVHDVIINDVNAAQYEGSGNLFQLASEFTNKVFNSVTINHVSGVPDEKNGVLAVGARLSALPSSITVINNLFVAGKYPVWSTGSDGVCSTSTDPLTLLNACWESYDFTYNAFVQPSEQAKASWPAGNIFPASIPATGYSGTVPAKGSPASVALHSFQLLADSPYRNAGNDGKDLGADVSAVLSYTAGVE
ncbi:MAG: hypothetical protein JOY93_06460 [Acidobacteriales bacterium]|nr:hypothetical protein [Terriglobales bacterium]